MKIAIVGLTEYENLGDQFIGKTVEYLVRQYGQVDTELIDFSIGKKKGGMTFILRGLHKISRILKFERLSYWLCIKKYQSYYPKTIFMRLRDVDGLIFSCGSFKYGTQELWAQYSVIIDYANKHNIPVMFNAMNVQKYQASDFRCQYLKKHLNFPCVKFFTSRDGEAGVKRLKKDYCEGVKLEIYPAADPAFWIPETYRITKNAQGSVIGVNVIAPNRFLTYGGTLAPGAVKKAYIDFLKKLTKNGFKWQLFTNGMMEDNIFAKELATSCMASGGSMKIPQSDRDLVQMEAGYMAVFGARLHSMICAYSLGVPVCGFVWDEKVMHFAEMARLKDVFLQENEVNGDAMYDVLLNTMVKKDNKDNRNIWKETTKETICAYLESLN